MSAIVSLIAGLLFGFGLILSGMYSPDTIISGLKLGSSTFKMDLYVTFTSALLTTFFIYQLRKRMIKPILNKCYDLPAKEKIDWQLILGAVAFGLGWGITGICPGPNIVGLGIFSWPLYWLSFSGLIIGFTIVKLLGLKDMH